MDEDFGGLQNISLNDDERHKKRLLCSSGCGRPLEACWCSSLPSPKISPKKTKIILLQHPNEERRGIRTGKILESSIVSKSFSVIRGRKFPGKNEELLQLFSQSNVYLLFPSQDSIDIRNLKTSESLNIFLFLDGTWDEAKKLYSRNPSLQNLPKIKLNVQSLSEYVVRTQPTDACLSTVESAAYALSVSENDPSIIESLLKPLRTLCNIQLKYGADKHDSKKTKRKIFLNQK